MSGGYIYENWPGTTLVKSWTTVSNEEDTPEGWFFMSWADGPPSDPVGPPVSLADAAEFKRTELRNACSEEITRSSFQSDALGAVHNYDSRIVDQLNLKIRFDIATMTVSTEPLWASDGTRYQWKLHTAAEIMKVMVDMNEHVKEAQVKLASKLASVDAATTHSQIDAVVW